MAFRIIFAVAFVLGLSGCQSYRDWVNAGGNIGPDIGQYLPGGKSYEREGPTTTTYVIKPLCPGTNRCGNSYTVDTYTH